MSEDTNKELEQVNENKDNFTEVVAEKIEDVKVEEPVVVEEVKTVVEVPVAATPEVTAVPTPEVIKTEEVTPVEAKPEITSETVIEADVNHEVVETPQNNVGTIEEVTVQVDSDAFNTLNEGEVSENSVFNKKEEVVVTGMKEGQEHFAEKKGFPWFMVLALILVIVIACNVDKIDGIVQKIKEKQKEPAPTEEKKEEEEKVGKELSLNDIKTALDSSELVVDFEKRHTVELNIVILDNKLVFTTTDYLNLEGVDNLTVEFVHDKHILTANVEYNDSEFGKEIAILLIKEIGILQGMNLVELENYVDKNLYTMTLDKGFELTNSEDGNNSYRIMTNVIFKID